MIKLRDILNEDESSTLSSNISKWMDFSKIDGWSIDQLIGLIKIDSKTPEALDNINISVWRNIDIKLQKAIALDFATRITPTSSKDHMVDVYMAAIKSAYANKNITQLIVTEIGNTWNMLPPTTKALAKAGWKITWKSTVTDTIAMVLTMLAWLQYQYFDNAIATKALYEVMHKNGAGGTIDDELWNAYEASATSNSSYAYMIDSIYNELNNHMKIF